MRLVSLFAGIGGFDTGFERAGFEIVGHVEIDANCRKLLAAKWPMAACWDDVRTAGAHNLPPCDVVTFGFPCQDLSVAGKRAGLAGWRSGLFYEATRIINEIKPAYCLFENVPGLLSSDKGRDFARVLMEMDKIGYSGAWRVLDAQWFGVAQRRRRVFGLFTRLDSGAERCAEILSIPEGLRGHPAPRREAGEVSPTLPASGSGTGRCGGQELTELGFCIIPEVCGCIQERDAKGSDSDTKPGHLITVLAVLTAQTSANGHGISVDCAHTIDGANGQAVAFKPSHYTRGKDGAPSEVVAPLSADADRGDQESLIAQVQWASGGGKTENDTAQALRAGAETNYHFVRIGLAVRRLTPTECERLQGFPDGWTEKACIVVARGLFCWQPNNKELSCEQNARLKGVIGSLWTEKTGCALCTISASKSTEAQTFLKGSLPSGNVLHADERCNTSQEDGARDAISLGEDTAILLKVGGAQKPEQNKASVITKTEKVDGSSICGSLNLYLAETYTKERLSTILTWINATTLLKTCLSAVPEGIIIKLIIRWNSPESNCSSEDSFGFVMENITPFSDSTRYKMLGNAVCVNVAEWIARRMKEEPR